MTAEFPPKPHGVDQNNPDPIETEYGEVVSIAETDQTDEIEPVTVASAEEENNNVLEEGDLSESEQSIDRVITSAEERALEETSLAQAPALPAETVASNENPREAYDRVYDLSRKIDHKGTLTKSRLEEIKTEVESVRERREILASLLMSDYTYAGVSNSLRNLVRATESRDKLPPEIKEKIRETVGSILLTGIHKAIPNIDKEYGICGRTFGAIELLLETAGPHESESDETLKTAARSVVDQTAPAVIAKLKSMVESADTETPRYGYLKALPVIIQEGNESVHEAALDFITDTFDHPESSGASMVDVTVDLLMRKGVSLEQKDTGLTLNLLEGSGHIMGKFLEKHGFPFLDTINAWLASRRAKTEQLADTFLENLKAVRDLDAQREKGAQTLRERFNLKALGRYSTNMLVRQFDEKDNATMPYGVVVEAVNDHNGAFFGIKHPLNSLSDQLANEGVGLRVFEVGRGSSALRMKRSIEEHYPGNKAKFALVGAHGSPASMEFNSVGSENQGYLSKDFVSNSKLLIPAMEEILDPEATVILVSCETGGVDNMADALTKKLHGRPVIAHKKPVLLRSVAAKVTDGKVSLTPEWFVAKKINEDGSAEWEKDTSEPALMHVAGRPPQKIE